MTNAAKLWFGFAAKDMASAKILFKNKEYENCIWHCHQALEKQFKGVIASQGKTVRKTHDLPALLIDTGFTFPEEVLKFTENLNVYYQPARYPDAVLKNPPVFNRRTADRFVKLTETTIKWIKLHGNNKQDK